MHNYFLSLLFIFPIIVFSQKTDKYSSVYSQYFRAEELFQKAQYSAAREEFRGFISSVKSESDPLVIKSYYYEGLSALELYNSDAILLLEAFNKNYPDNIYKHIIGFRLGKYFFQKNDFEKAQEWFNKVPIKELDQSLNAEYYFKFGYSALQNGDNSVALISFREAKEGKSKYAAPSLYFFSHLNYLSSSLQVALEGFEKLLSDSTFCGVVPYYIAQIYHKQGRFEDVINFSPTLTSCTFIDNESDISHLIGNAHYRLKNYKLAIPFLENFNKKNRPSRDDLYELGFCYYKTEDYEKAVCQFDKCTLINDSIAQIAFYQIGESYLGMGKLLPSRSAFEKASEMNSILEIQEDALYNFAVISFKVDINPYDESVRAFENYLNKYPNSIRKKDIFQYLVNVYTNTSNFAKALESLDKLLAKDNKLQSVYQTVAFNYGVELYQKNSWDDAKKAFELVGRYPIDPEMVALSNYWIADLNLRMDNTNDAIAAYRSFLGSPASNALAEKTDAYYNLGYAYLEKEQLKEAINSFRIYLQSNPQNENKKIDAYFRIADCYYLNKDDNLLAIQYYNEALKMDTEQNDKALFYLAKSYGYNGQLDEKIAILNELLNNYKLSKYSMTGSYELARSYVSKAEYDEAMTIFKSYVADYPKATNLIDARLGIADLYFKKWDYSQAELEYTKILEEFETVRDVCEKAVKGLVDVYAAQKNPEMAADIADRYPCANISKDEKENLFYNPALQSYMDSSYSEAIPKFELYLTKFPSGRFTNETYYFLGNSLYKTKDTLNAVKYFEQFLETPNNVYSELAASRTAGFYYSKQNYVAALKYYEKLDQLASKPSGVLNAKMGLMRCVFLTENYSKASIYAKIVLGTSGISTQQKIEGEYANAISNYNLKNYEEAKESLEWLVKNTTTAMGSESKYTIADIYFKKAQYEQADIEIKSLLKMKPSYNYWVAKGLILQSRIMIINNDLFQAEQTLKSVLDYYPDQNDDVISNANELWAELMQLKNPVIIEEEEVIKKIEINEE
jgi:tetratricopeptide (TPR) repeat protein